MSPDATRTVLSEPGFADIEAASKRLSGVVLRTPLLESHYLNERTGGRVLIKPESLQHTGSFKYRGASNRMARLSADERAAGVIAFSSGNHAQAVALAARRLSVHATIVMPRDAPQMKLDNTRAFGADVVLYERRQVNREEVAVELQGRIGGTIIRPFDDPDIIAGQGTVGLEIAQDVAARKLQPDAMLVPCGGGGLIAGSALAVRESFPETAVFSVEPTDYDDTRQSLERGERVGVPGEAPSICDALLLTIPGELTFTMNRRLLAGGLSVSEADVRGAMRFAFDYLKLVVEPGGAVALAALLCGAFDAKGKIVVIVLSGGNVDRELFAQILRD